MADRGTAGPTHTLVYDGTCGVCTRLVGMVERWDGGRSIAPMTSADALAGGRFPWIPAGAYADAMQLVGPGGRTWAGAEAVERLLELLPKGWLAGWVFRLPFAGGIADRLYRGFARNRHVLGCGDHCGVTSPARRAPRSETSPGSPHES